MNRADAGEIQSNVAWELGFVVVAWALLYQWEAESGGPGVAAIDERYAVACCTDVGRWYD